MGGKSGGFFLVFFFFLFCNEVFFFFFLNPVEIIPLRGRKDFLYLVGTETAKAAEKVSKRNKKPEELRPCSKGEKKIATSAAS